MKILNFISQEVADHLRDLGFKYTVQHYGELTVYSFLGSEELMEIVAGTYSKRDYFTTDVACFST